MRVVILMRYPLLDRSDWKIRLIRKLAASHDVKVVFGECGLYPQFRAAVKAYAAKNGVPSNLKKSVSVWQTCRKEVDAVRVRSINSTATRSVIENWKPDIVLMLGTGIIRKVLIDNAGYTLVHCHHGYLPRFRGVNTAEWSMFLDGEVHLTFHSVNAGVDTGDILARTKINISGIRSVAELRAQCREQCVDFIAECIANFRTLWSAREPQRLRDGRQYYTMHKDMLRLVEATIANRALNEGRGKDGASSQTE